jgi:alkaline phosphatase
MKKHLLATSLCLCLGVGGAFAADTAAKYVFFFIGDGMGINHVNGMEMWAGEDKGILGVEPMLFTSFPFTGLSKTYSQSNGITDSSAGGTALSAGVKTKNGTIGMDHTHTIALETVAEKAHRAGRRVGVATSVSVDHATPAAFYAHQPSRSMYYEIGTDLAKSNFEFFAGSDFLQPTKKDDASSRNLFEIVADSGYTVVRGVEQYRNKANTVDKIILLQEEGKDRASLPFAIDRKEGDLTLAQITESAIDFLHRDGKGFFVMLEGGKIDWSSHSNDAATSLLEVKDMDNAVRVAYDFYLAHPDSTLIVITADHETGGLALGREGYWLNLKSLGSQKLSKANLSAELVNWGKANAKNQTWENMKAFLTEKLGFWNTIKISDKEEALLKKTFEDGFKKNDEKVKSEYFSDEKLAAVAIDILNRKANVGWTTDSHSNAYVPVFAIGVDADRFTGVMENVEIPRRIAEVAGY